MMMMITSLSVVPMFIRNLLLCVHCTVSYNSLVAHFTPCFHPYILKRFFYVLVWFYCYYVLYTANCSLICHVPVYVRLSRSIKRLLTYL